MDTKAGKGEHRVYRILPTKPGDTAKLTARNHYVALDAVAWYINKESSWFKNRMAAGTLDITLASGLERYQAGLGTFDLKGGAKVAPVFEKPVLPDRNYRGGPITVTASLTAIKKDTVIAGMLKSAASASLGIAAGMVQTATLAGPATLLTAAGTDLIGGVKKLLSDTSEKKEPLFDRSGLEYTMQPQEVIGPEVYLLFHRGELLEENAISIHKRGRLNLPFYNKAPLYDGAWLLLRIRRSDEYSGVREWHEAAREFRNNLGRLVDDVVNGFVSKEAALKRITPSEDANPDLYDEFTRLRTIIGNDGVLSEREAGLYVGKLTIRITLAKDAISTGKKKVYEDGLREVRNSLTKGAVLKGRLGEAFHEVVGDLTDSRSFSLARDTSLRRVSRLSGADLYETMQYMKKAIRGRDTV